MFCSQCGTQLPEAARFCSGCGISLTGGAAPPGADEESAPSYWRFIFIGLAVGAVILVAGGTWLFYNGKLKSWASPHEKQNTNVAANMEPTAPDDAAVDVADLTPAELQAARAALDEAISRAEQRAGQPVRTSLEK